MATEQPYEMHETRRMRSERESNVDNSTTTKQAGKNPRYKQGKDLVRSRRGRAVAVVMTLLVLVDSGAGKTDRSCRKVANGKDTDAGMASIRMEKLKLAEGNEEKSEDCRAHAARGTFPDIDYSLYGYNILQGYPLADGRDPGFTRALFAFEFRSGGHTADCRYTVPHGITAAPDVSCTTSFTSKLVENSKDLQSSLEGHAEAGGGGWGVSFSASASYKRNSAEISTGKTKIIHSTADCTYYFTKINQLEMPQYSLELVHWLMKLNQSMAINGTITDDDIFFFFNYFGTHFPSEVVYGARYTYESRMSAENFKNLTEEASSVEAKASYSGFFDVSGGAGMSEAQKDAAEKFKSKTTTRTTSIGAPPPYDGDAMTWASQVKDSPVPVQYKLVPIYELFSPEYTTRQLFSDSTRRQIRDMMMSYVRRYCYRLSNSGVDVSCTDKSLLKFDGISMGEMKDGIDKGLEDCIAECVRTRNCALVSYWPKKASLQSCYLTIGYVEQPLLPCTNCSSYIIPQALTQRMTLIGFTYDNSVTRRNKLDIQGTFDYDEISKFCALSCSKDHYCTGFEVSNRTDYNYNCATYSTHSTSLVKTEQRNFETQIMSDLAKRKTMDDVLRHKYFPSAAWRYVRLDSDQRFDQEIANCDTMCCNNYCISNINCVVGVYVLPKGSCKLIMDAANARLALAAGSSSDYVSVYLYHGRPKSGWFNITGIGEDNGKSRVLESADACAQRCARSVTCQAASWDDLLRTCTVIANPWENDLGFVSFKPNSKMMFPNYRLKINTFKLEK